MKTAMLLPIVLLTLTSTSLIANQSTTKLDSNGGSEKSMNNTKNEQTEPMAIILADHKRIEGMISNLNKHLDSNVAESRTRFTELKDFLVKHETMEEDTWYPELEKNDQLKTIIAHLKDQEKEANKAIKEIDGISDDKEWVAKVKKFTKDVEKHAKDEQTQLFPKVKEMMDKNALHDIEKKMQDYRAKNNMND